MSFCDLTSAHISAYVASLSAFVSAQIAVSRMPDNRRHEAIVALDKAAAAVQVDCVSAQTVESLATQLSKSVRTSMIYEQYCADMVAVTRTAMRKLSPLAAEALALHMQLETLVEDARLAHEAVQEAYEALYGEAEDWELN